MVGLSKPWMNKNKLAPLLREEINQQHEWEGRANNQLVIVPLIETLVINDRRKDLAIKIRTKMAACHNQEDNLSDNCYCSAEQKQTRCHELLWTKKYRIWQNTQTKNGLDSLNVADIILL